MPASTRRRRGPTPEGRARDTLPGPRAHAEPWRAVAAQSAPARAHARQGGHPSTADASGLSPWPHRPFRSCRRAAGSRLLGRCGAQQLRGRHLARSERQRQSCLPAERGAPADPDRRCWRVGACSVRWGQRCAAGRRSSRSVQRPDLFVVYRVRRRSISAGIFTASAATGTDHQQFFTCQYDQAGNQRIQLFGRSIQPNQVVARASIHREAVRHSDLRRRHRRRAARPERHRAATLELRAVRDSRGHGPRCPLQRGGCSGSARSTSTRSACIRASWPGERDQLETYVQVRHGLAWNPRFIGNDLAWLHDVDDERLRPDRRARSTSGTI